MIEGRWNEDRFMCFLKNSEYREVVEEEEDIEIFLNLI